jgi:ribokinase
MRSKGGVQIIERRVYGRVHLRILIAGGRSWSVPTTRFLPEVAGRVASDTSRLDLFGVKKDFIMSEITDHDSMTSAATTPNTTHGVVIVVGSVNQDWTVYTKTLPRAGETVPGSSVTTTCGGKGGNQAVAAASVRNDGRVSLLGRVGHDSMGQAIVTHLNERGVGTCDTLKSGSSHTGVATILVEECTGQNVIVVTPGANHDLTPDEVEHDLRRVNTERVVVLVQLEIRKETALRALQVAHSLSALTILNPAPAEYALDDFFPHVDIIIPNETELQTLCGAIGDNNNDDDDDLEDRELARARQLLERGVQQAVIVTLGARGAMVVMRHEHCLVPAMQSAEPVIDTIGAGDAFCGALASYLACSGSSDLLNQETLVSAATRACAFASLSVQRAGATYPRYQELPSSLQIEP